MSDRPATIPDRPAQFARAGSDGTGSNGAGPTAGNRRPPWADAEAMLDEAAALAAADLPPETFAAAFLNRLVRGTGAAGALLWDRTGEGGRTTLTPSAAEGLTAEEIAGEDPAAHAKLLAEAADGPPRLVNPHAGGRGGAGNPGGRALALCPDGAGGVLEAAFDPRVLAAGGTGGKRIVLEAVRSFAEVFEESRTRHEVRQLRAELGRRRRLDGFAAAVHAARGLAATCAAVAHDGQTAAGVDRLAAAAPGKGLFGGGLRVRAVSGSDRFDRRAGSVRSLERIAKAAARASRRTGRDLFTARAAGDGPPETDEVGGEFAGRLTRDTGGGAKLDRAVVAHFDESGGAAVTAAVLRDPAAGVGRNGAGKRGRVVGVLVGEDFPRSADEPDAQREPLADRVARVAPHAAAALAHARVAERTLPGKLAAFALAPLAPARLPWTIPAAVLLAAAVGALVFVPAPFTVTARGRLVPAVRRDVFAPHDGVVRTLTVDHNDAVDEGETLAVLFDADLELRAEELAGEAETAAERLAAVRAARGAGRTGMARTDPTGRLAAEERELTERLSHLAEQRRLLDRQRESLTLTSPIAGRVLTWGLAERLPGRPVARGQRLMTVADPAGPWTLELFVPDRHAGPLTARDDDDEPLRATYLLATDPGPTYAVTIDHVDPSVEPHGFAAAGAAPEPSVRVTAELAAGDVPDPRPGATVVARIACGERSLGYVWLHDLIDGVRGRFWW